MSDRRLLTMSEDELAAFLDGEWRAQVGTINADGLLVAPGWVDVHSHYDGQALWGRRVLPVEIWMLPWWGLIEPHTTFEVREDEDGTVREVEVEVPGEYFISELGELWIKGLGTIPGHALTYDRRVLRLDDEVELDVYQGLGRDFDLDDLIGEDPPKRMALLLSGAEVKRPRRGR